MRDNKKTGPKKVSCLCGDGGVQKVDFSSSTDFVSWFGVCTLR